MIVGKKYLLDQMEKTSATCYYAIFDETNTCKYICNTIKSARDYQSKNGGIVYRFQHIQTTECLK